MGKRFSPSPSPWDFQEEYEEAKKTLAEAQQNHARLQQAMAVNPWAGEPQSPGEPHHPSPGWA